MPKSLSDCHSCAQKFEAQYPYCPYCGQKAQTKLTLGVLFNNTINNYFSVDARFFKSFVPLILKPGYLAKKFVQGKRAYLHPAQFYLFISIVFFFLFSFISRKQSEVLNEASHRLFEDKEAVESLMDNSLQFRNGNDVGEKHRGNVGMTVSVDTINSSSGTNSFNN
ncbi:MAG TPA: DUF3667 domain-containing protein, partial [Aquaticitalea sp.]|nr:DUF3667 domain-containing protein [Aquaticitalea sp.]